MTSLKPLPEFTAWLENLPDVAVRSVVVARLKRLELGLMGDVEPLGDSVSEPRIHIGAGWRVYFTQRGAQLIVLLAGGSKRSQKHDIKMRQEPGRTAGLIEGDQHDPTHQCG